MSFLNFKRSGFILFCITCAPIFADGIGDDVNMSGILDDKKTSGPKLESLSAGWGSEHYVEGDNLYFYKVDAQGSWEKDRFFMVSARVYHSGAEGPGGIPSATFTITPLYTTRNISPENSKIKITETRSYLPFKYERDTGVYMEHSIQAALVGIRRDVSVPITGALAAFVALEAQILSGRWVQFPEGEGNFIGVAPLSGNAALGFVYSPSQSVDITLTLAGISGDMNYGKTYGSQSGISPRRYTNYAVYSSLSVLLKKWDITLSVEGGKVFRNTKPSVLDESNYPYVGFSASKKF